MDNILHVISLIIGAIVGTLGIMSYLVYTKSQVNEKISESCDALKKDSNKKIEQIEATIEEIKNTIHEDQITNHKDLIGIKDEIYDRLNENKQAFEKGMEQFVSILSDIKEADKDSSVHFITMINTVKDELKNDYTARYNDLLTLMSKKADETDFNRLEQKFDKVSETITELKTIVQMQTKDKRGQHE